MEFFQKITHNTVQMGMADIMEGYVYFMKVLLTQPIYSDIFSTRHYVFHACTDEKREVDDIG